MHLECWSVVLFVSQCFTGLCSRRRIIIYVQIIHIFASSFAFSQCENFRLLLKQFLVVGFVVPASIVFRENKYWKRLEQTHRQQKLDEKTNKAHKTAQKMSVVKNVYEIGNLKKKFSSK